MGTCTTWMDWDILRMVNGNCHLTKFAALPVFCMHLHIHHDNFIHVLSPYSSPYPFATAGVFLSTLHYCILISLCTSTTSLYGAIHSWALARCAILPTVFGLDRCVSFHIPHFPDLYYYFCGYVWWCATCICAIPLR